MVQSVSTPACHAGGRRFESVRGRQKIKPIHLDGFYFLLPDGLELSNKTCLWQVFGRAGPRPLHTNSPKANLRRVRSGSALWLPGSIQGISGSPSGGRSRLSKNYRSSRTSPQTGVAIPQNLGKSAFSELKMLRITGGFPRQCAHWLGMTTFLTR